MPIIREITILNIADQFVCLVTGICKVPYSDGRFYRAFDRIEDAHQFRKENQ